MPDCLDLPDESDRLFLFGADKRRARTGRWRIPERTLWMVSVLGGGVGAVSGMRLFRHKTKKGGFRIGLPLLALLQAGLAGYAILSGLQFR